MTDVKRKAKRRLSNFDFSQEGAHLALVHKEQGGAANGYATLVMKSAANFSDEFIEKMQQVRVTLELPEFLTQFFNLYYDDAEVLARLMGYVPEEEEESETLDYYQDYIEGRLEAFEVIKSLNESKSLAEGLSNLSEDKYLAVLRDQERLEKSFEKVELAKAEAVEKQAEAKQPVVAEPKKTTARIIAKAEISDAGHKAESSEAVEKQAVEGNDANEAVKAESTAKTKLAKSEVTMTKEAVVVEKVSQTEMVEKAEFDLIQKAMAEQKAELQKAMEMIEVFKAEKKEAIAKARKDVLVEAIQEENAEVIFKAVGELEDEAFDAVVGVLKSLATASEKNEMFVEKGVSIEGDGAEDELTAVLKARYKK